MNELIKWQTINACKSLEQLGIAIIHISGPSQIIQGTSKEFDAIKMATYAANFNDYPDNYLTRNYGIRQQAIYLSKKRKPLISNVSKEDMEEFLNNI